MAYVLGKGDGHGVLVERRAEPRSHREPWPGGLLSGAFDPGGISTGVSCCWNRVKGSSKFRRY